MGIKLIIIIKPDSDAIPLDIPWVYLHKESNHIYTIWQYIVLVTTRQYEGKNYRMFT